MYAAAITAYGQNSLAKLACISRHLLISNRPGFSSAARLCRSGVVIGGRGIMSYAIPPEKCHKFSFIV